MYVHVGWYCTANNVSVGYMRISNTSPNQELLEVNSLTMDLWETCFRRLLWPRRCELLPVVCVDHCLSSLIRGHWMNSTCSQKNRRNYMQTLWLCCKSMHRSMAKNVCSLAKHFDSCLQPPGIESEETYSIQFKSCRIQCSNICVNLLGPNPWTCKSILISSYNAIWFRRWYSFP